MEQRLKERLFGAVIIISLFVIFLPMVFKAPDDGSLIKEEGKPMPAIPEVSIEPPQTLSQWGDAITQQAVANEVAAAWTIQLATFANKKNASQLVTKLKDKGYAAYLESVPGHERNLTWVMVGPHAKKEDAIAQQDQLKAEFKMNGLVINARQAS